MKEKVTRNYTIKNDNGMIKEVYLGLTKVAEIIKNRNKKILKLEDYPVTKEFDKNIEDVKILIELSAIQYEEEVKKATTEMAERNREFMQKQNLFFDEIERKVNSNFDLDKFCIEKLKEIQKIIKSKKEDKYKRIIPMLVDLSFFPYIKYKYTNEELDKEEDIVKEEYLK